jgi:hypothetical protein
VETGCSGDNTHDDASLSSNAGARQTQSAKSFDMNGWIEFWIGTGCRVEAGWLAPSPSQSTSTLLSDQNICNSGAGWLDLPANQISAGGRAEATRSVFFRGAARRPKKRDLGGGGQGGSGRKDPPSWSCGKVPSRGAARRRTPSFSSGPRSRPSNLPSEDELGVRGAWACADGTAT